MDFFIFDRSDALVFIRGDAEEAIHIEEEYRLKAIFPLVHDKMLQPGHKIGFTDQENIFQLLEIREPKTDLPENTQTVDAEHAAIAELTDEMLEDVRPTNTTAAGAAASVLSGTGWTLGTIVASGNDSIRFFYVNIWSALCAIRDKWGVRIRPRVTFDNTGITGRYIDILSAVPTYRGVRLEIDKNIENIGVAYNDRELYTALYGRGKGKSTAAGDDTSAAKVSFADIVWSTEDDNPADKPAGQKWVEDVTATAMFGRNGRRRTGVAEFPDIEDPEALLQATWDRLQLIKYPRLTIDCTIYDLYAYGYNHEQMLRNDEVAVIVDPIGLELKATVRQMARDLLHPDNTRPVIGSYRAGIEYATALNSDAASTLRQITNSNPDLIRGVINTMVTAILSTGTKMYTDPVDGALVLETPEGTKAVKLAGAGILLASAIVSGKWQWRTAITGSGMVADEITAGILRATLVTILGNENFYITGPTLYINDPDDPNKQIRIGLYNGTDYGIGFTSDGGETWNVAVNFDGSKLSAEDESRVSSLEVDVNGINARVGAAEGDIAELELTAQGLSTDVSNAEGDIAALEITAGQLSTRMTNAEGDIASIEAGVTGITLVVSAKSTVYVQASPPSGTAENPIKNGDIWFDSDDSYKQYTRSGSSWVAGVVAGLKTSFIDIANDIIHVYAGGSVDIQTNNFQIKNAAGKNMMRITDEDPGTGDPGGQMELGEDGYPVKFRGNFVLQPEQGGTGYQSGQLHRVTAWPPPDDLGKDGDGYIFFNGDAEGHGDISPSIGGGATATYFGRNRVWNHVPLSGWVDVGNLGTGLTLYGSYWTFTTPSGGLTSLTLQFIAAKYVSGTWYGWNLALPLTVAVFSGTGSGTVLGSNTFVPPNNAALQSVPITFDTPLSGGVTYYIAIYSASEGQNQSKAIVQLATVLIPGTSAEKTEGFGIKSHGMVVDLMAGQKKIFTGSCVASSSGTAIDYSAANFTEVPFIIATYSKASSPFSGDSGALKVSNKTTSGATIEIGGSFSSRDVDWVAIGA